MAPPHEKYASRWYAIEALTQGKAKRTDKIGEKDNELKIGALGDANNKTNSRISPSSNLTDEIGDEPEGKYMLSET